MMAPTVTAAMVVLGALTSHTFVANDDSDAGTDDSGFWVHEVEESQGQPNVANPLEAGDDRPETTPILLGDGACNAADQVSGELVTVTFCTGPAPEQALSIGDVRSAFARLDLPAATLVIQPPDGLTLVNFDTNFYTTSTRPITRTVTLLGQQVTLVATPAEFHWDFGDGGAVTTTEPGAPYPDLTVTHNYLQTGTYRPSLATTFTGRFRVGDGAWQQIPGTVTIDGTGQALRAIEAQPKLVGY